MSRKLPTTFDHSCCPSIYDRKQSKRRDVGKLVWRAEVAIACGGGGGGGCGEGGRGGKGRGLGNRPFRRFSFACCASLISVALTPVPVCRRCHIAVCGSVFTVCVCHAVVSPGLFPSFSLLDPATRKSKLNPW